jgi:serine/threonine protein kinase
MLNPELTLAEGVRIENFEIRRKLGRGGFGVTYLATEYARAQTEASASNQVFSREVALKEFFPQGISWRAEDSRVVPATAEGAEVAFFHAMKAFLREAQAISRLDHHHIVRILSVFESHGTAYFVMPYIPGISLRGRLRQRGTLDQAEIESTVLPVLDGLEEAHSVGIIHRDIKPENIMLRERSDQPVLIDFGAARMTVSDDTRQHTHLDSIACFTPGYAPIEQYARSATENRHGAFTDLYSFCALLYVCVTGKVPPEASLRSLDVNCGRPDPLMPASRQRAGEASYSPALLAAIDWGLEILSPNRPQTVAELRDCIMGRIPIPKRNITQMTMVPAAAPAPAPSPAAAPGQAAQPPAQPAREPERRGEAARPAPAPAAGKGQAKEDRQLPPAGVPEAASRRSRKIGAAVGLGLLLAAAAGGYTLLAASRAHPAAAAAVDGLVDQGNGVLQQVSSGLQWTQRDDRSGNNWSNAQAYCSSLGTAGGGWRLPSPDELLSIYDRSLPGSSCGSSHYWPLEEYACHVSPLFSLSDPLYWSSETPGSDVAVIVDLRNGDRVKLSSQHVGSQALCVRHS